MILVPVRLHNVSIQQPAQWPVMGHTAVTVHQVLTVCVKYRIFPKYGRGVNYFQMASDQALN